MKIKRGRKEKGRKGKEEAKDVDPGHLAS